MAEFFMKLAQFTAGTGVWVYVFIFFGKILEVAMSTLRLVLINRGERMIGSVIALVEILLWLVIAGSVLKDYQSAPLKMLVYALSFALGTFAGSWIEERLAFGLCSLQVVAVDREKSELIVSALRNGGFGVTELEAQGRDGTAHYMLLSILKRKLAGDAIGIVQSIVSDAVITVSDVKSQRGGYLRSAPGFRARKHSK